MDEMTGDISAVDGADAPDILDDVADGQNPEQLTEEITQDAPEDDGQERFEIKVNGKSMQMTVPELIKDAQMYHATNIKLDQAKKTIKEAEAHRRETDSVRTGMKTLLDFVQNGDFEQIEEFIERYSPEKQNEFNMGVIKHALKLHEYNQMPPEKREYIQTKKELDRIKKENESRTKSETDKAYNSKVEGFSQQLATELPKAITAAGLPDTAYIRNQIVNTWTQALSSGKIVDCATVVNFVKKQLTEANMLPKAGVQKAKPKATLESVGLTGKTKAPAYKSWSDMQAERNKRS